VSAVWTVIRSFCWPSVAVAAGSGVSFLAYLSQLPCQESCSVRFAPEGKYLYPVSHRQYVFSIPKILRTYFKYDRKLLGKFCQCINQSLLQFFRQATGLKKGNLGKTLGLFWLVSAKATVAAPISIVCKS